MRNQTEHVHINSVPRLVVGQPGLTTVIVLAFSLAGCSPSRGADSGQQIIDRVEATWNIKNPVGAYQMLPGENPSSVAVLDTRTGRLQNCFLVDSRYHCLAQTNVSQQRGGLPSS